MRYFWYSLIVFLLLMCSCKTQKLDSNVKTRTDVQSELAYLNKVVGIDTTRTFHSEQLNQRIVIEEETTIIEYDKESGKPIKETTSKRKTTQDSDKVVAEEVQNGVIIEQNDSINHIEDNLEMVDTEVKEESIGGQESFGKWLGIILGCVIGILIIYLLIKLRVN